MATVPDLSGNRPDEAPIVDATLIAADVNATAANQVLANTKLDTLITSNAAIQAAVEAPLDVVVTGQPIDVTVIP